MENNEIVNLDKCLEIEGIDEGSIAEELGLEVGDKIFKINGTEIRDFIDYKFLMTDIYLEVEVIKQDEEYWVLEIEKEYDEPLGVQFSEIIFDGLKKCHNNCIFCFVDQAPSESRTTLNLKDDDYRFSFLEGSYITLTNLSETELKRIKRMQLSPLNVSVHSTEAELREKMLNNKHAGRILEQIEELTTAGIELNTQVVLCPGVNDGIYLERTIEDLAGFLPQIKSLAIVPVGLTKFREGLSDLRSFSRQEAKELINLVKEWQTKFRAKYGISFVYLADEFYFLADQELPLAEEYDDFLQLENGVGMARLFWDQFSKLEGDLPDKLSQKRVVSIVSGVLGAKVLEPIITRLNQIENLTVELIVVENDYFGSEVTVTGLLTGGDILEKLQEIKQLGEMIIIPEVLLNEEKLFLDDLSLDEFKSQIPVEVKTANNEPSALLEQIFRENYGGAENE
ncbi:DUF512 domain-containing protein [Natroniella sulfidigena]|uniref:DUF512 domain-containing protein n=1 Tax=Natroniella sulfidigena TaxID=723921 RepID=UPI00200A590A|nr:DUF512 domain-containing protein [Natroniella sulfidigena]MCK8817750.1 DUF512 domain-containing protein [Natroniella sulfidigena]